MASLEGRVALVVGASRGMGKQMALELARRGADVAVAARTTSADEASLPGTISATADEIRALGRRATAIKVDVGVGAEIDAMVAKALETFGRIDLLVHSVQYHGPAYYALFADTAIEELEQQMAVNAMSAIRTCKRLVPHMAERGEGRIVIVTSLAGTYDTGLLPGEGSTGIGYAISKAALGRFVPALAKEVRKAGIAVIGMNPGLVASEHVEAELVDGKYHGWSIAGAVPPTVPAKAVGFLCTCDDPMAFSGKVLESDEIVAEHKLVPNPKNSYAGAEGAPEGLGA
jgi:NAD(P)-dependent dehydrogenase (short-subunit alcohol dehydrogenase family)